MNIMNIVVIAIVTTIFATITLASISYAVFRLRDRRVPQALHGEPSTTLFFERVHFSASENGSVRSDRPAVVG